MKPCSKNRYDSELDAKLVAMRLQYANPKKLEPKFCDKCKAWHLWQTKG